jgi:hypothetical protein
VKRHALRTFELLLFPTLGLAAVALFVPGYVSLAARLYALVLALIGIGVVVAALRRSYPRATPVRPTRRAPGSSRSQLPELARIERELGLGISSSWDLHFRLRPRVRRIAAGLLAAHRGISLDAEPERARAVLGDDAWELVRPDREAPERKLDAGLAVEEAQRLVATLEAI